MEANEEAQDGSGDGSGAGSGDGNESSSGDGNGDEDGNGNGNENRIGEGGGEAKKRKKPLKSTVVDFMWETGETRVERGKDVDKERIDPVELPTQII